MIPSPLRSRAPLLLALLLALLLPVAVLAQDGFGFGNAQGGRSGFGPAQGTSTTTDTNTTHRSLA